MTLEETLSANGFVYPEFTISRAEMTKLPLQCAMAMLMMETSGGHNEFGHDPGNPVQGGEVTEARYKELRAYVARGYASQGVGPCQLTSVFLLDEADDLGGAWEPNHNMHVGFSYLHALQTQYGLQGGFTHYNGSGPAAESYGYRAMKLCERYETLIANVSK